MTGYYLTATNRVCHPWTIQHINMASTTDELYQSFMASTAGSERAQRELRRLLSSCDKLPEQQSPVHLLPIDEMELRLHHIRELEDYWRQHFTRLTQRPQNQYRGFNDLEFSALIQMDYHYLRNMMQEGTTGAWDYCLNSLQVVPVTVKMCTSFYPLQTPFLYSLTEPVVATKKKTRTRRRHARGSIGVGRSCCDSA